MLPSSVLSHPPTTHTGTQRTQNIEKAQVSIQVAHNQNEEDAGVFHQHVPPMEEGDAAPLPCMELPNELPAERLRNYQQAALTKARRSNIIMCGAAGIGKTHVALSLLREADYSEGQIAFFLATTRHLAEQQYQRIRNATSLTTKFCVGMEYDLWSKTQWQTLFQENQVIVCTPQVLLNVLNKGSEYITVRRINLLILDECHKAHRNHPYTQVMHHYERAEALGPHPRVFGMTATPSKFCHQILHCTLHMCPLDDIRLFAAKAPLSVIQYQEEDHVTREKRLIKAGQRLLNPITSPHTGEAGPVDGEAAASAMEDENYTDDDCENHHEEDGPRPTAHLDGSSGTEIAAILKEVKLCLPSVTKTKSLDLGMVRPSHNHVGNWFGARHILLVLDHWIGTTPLSRSERDVMEGILARKLALYLRKVLAKVVQLQQFQLTDRVEKLVQCLRQRREQDGENFRAIVFVQRRTTCRVLFEFLNLLEPFTGRCGFAIGQATASGVSAFGLKRNQRRPIKDFASGKLQVLVATDVLSEGIDVPECSLVVAFDTVANPTAFVQMRGRARLHDGGAFVLFAPDRETLERIFQLEQGAAYFEKEMLDKEDVFMLPRDMSLSRAFPHFPYILPTTGASINLNNSRGFLNQICQWNKECMSYRLSPVAETQEKLSPDGQRMLYKCVLTLPAVFDFPSFESSLFPAKAIACAVAAFHACVEFHRRGLVDDNLNPVRESIRLETYEHFIPEFAGVQVVNERVEMKTRAAAHLGLSPMLREGTQDEAATEGAAATTAGEMEVEEAPNEPRTGVAPDGAVRLPPPPGTDEDAQPSVYYSYRMDEEASCVAVLTKTLLSEDILEAEGLTPKPALVLELTTAQVGLLAKFHVVMLHFVLHGPGAFKIEFAPLLQIEDRPPRAGKKRGQAKRIQQESTPPVMGEAGGGDSEGGDGGEEQEQPSPTMPPSPSAAAEEEGEVASMAEGDGDQPAPLSAGEDKEKEDEEPEKMEEEKDKEPATPTFASMLGLEKEKKKKKKQQRSSAGLLDEEEDEVFFSAPLEPKAALDKGYVLVPLKPDGEVDWDLVKSLAQDAPSRELVHGRGEFWPLPSEDPATLRDSLLFTCSALSSRPKLWAPIEMVADQTLAGVREAAAAAAAARVEREAKAKAEAQATAEAEAQGKKDLEAQAKAVSGAEMEVEEDAAPSAPAPDCERSSGTKRDKEGAQAEKEMSKRQKQGAEDEDKVAEAGSEKMESDSDKKAVEKEEGVEGKKMENEENKEEPEPRLHLFEYPVEVWDRCDQAQSLLLVEKIVDSPFRFRGLARDGQISKEGEEVEDVAPKANTPKSLRQSRLYSRRLLAPELCSFIRVPKSLYVACQRLLPQLWRLEIALKVNCFIRDVGIPVQDSSVIRTALCKPDYERLEVLGDTYLKLVMSCVVLRKEPYLVRESLLHDFRCNLICNRRLVQAALNRGIEGHIVLRMKILNEPYRHWAPSLMAPLASTASEVNVKVVADVVEALIGAYLIDGGPRAADDFLQWLGFPVMCTTEACGEQHAGMVGLLEAPAPFFKAGPPAALNVADQRGYWPLLQRRCQCWTEVALAETPQTIFPKPTPAPASDLVKKVEKLEALLGYTYRNKWLALQALTHPSHSQKSRRSERGQGDVVFISDYQRLEFLGDALLDYMVMVQILFENPDFMPKPLHVEKRQTVSNEHLAKRALEWLQLHRFYDSDSIELNRCVEMYVNDSVALDGGREGKGKQSDGAAGSESGPKALADVLEALIASVYIDSEGDIQRLVEVFVPFMRRKAAAEEAEDSREARIGLTVITQSRLQQTSVHELSVEDEEQLRGLLPTLVRTLRMELAMENDDDAYKALISQIALETSQLTLSKAAEKEGVAEVGGEVMVVDAE